MILGIHYAYLLDTIGCMAYGYFGYDVQNGNLASMAMCAIAHGLTTDTTREHVFIMTHVKFVWLQRKIQTCLEDTNRLTKM